MVSAHSLRHKIFARSMTFMLLFALVPAGVFAQQAEQPDDDSQFSDQVCNTTPAAMSEYVGFAKKMLTVLVYIEEPNPVTPPLGAWQGGQYSVNERIKASKRKNNPNLFQQIFDGIAADGQRKLDGLTNTALLVSSQVKLTLFDGAKGMLAIFYQPRPIIRDLRKLYEIDQLIGEKVDRLGQPGHYFETVHPLVYKDIEELMLQNIGGNHMFNEAQIAGGVTYENMVNFLMFLNEKHKAFLADSGIKRFDNKGQTNAMKRGIIEIDMNAAHGERLKSQYKAARRGICNTSRKTFKENINNLAETFKGGVGNEFKKMADAVKRLGGINFNTRADADEQYKQEFLDREYELLQTHYGFDVDKAQQGASLETNVSEAGAELKGGLGLGALRRAAFNKNKKSKEQILADRAAKQELREQQKAARLAEQTLKQQQKAIARAERQAAKAALREARGNTPETIYFPAIEGDLVVDMSEATSTIVALHEESLVLMLATQPTDLSDTIGALLQRIRLAELYITGDGSEDDLIHHLGKSCEMQCSNAGGECRDT